MYTIYIEIDVNKVPTGKAEEMLNQHRAWFKTFFDAGKFLMIGPCPDVPGTGLIIAHAESHEEIEDMLTSDAYYANQLATYTVHEFTVTMFNENIKNYVG